jgi:hypothetical protein
MRERKLRIAFFVLHALGGVSHSFVLSYLDQPDERGLSDAILPVLQQHDKQLTRADGPRLVLVSQFHQPSARMSKK